MPNFLLRTFAGQEFLVESETALDAITAFNEYMKGFESELKELNLGEAYVKERMLSKDYLNHTQIASVGLTNIIPIEPKHIKQPYYTKLWQDFSKVFFDKGLIFDSPLHDKENPGAISLKLIDRETRNPVMVAFKNYEGDDFTEAREVCAKLIFEAMVDALIEKQTK